MRRLFATILALGWWTAGVALAQQPATPTSPFAPIETPTVNPEMFKTPQAPPSADAPKIKPDKSARCRTGYCNSKRHRSREIQTAIRRQAHQRRHRSRRQHGQRRDVEPVKSDARRDTRQGAAGLFRLQAHHTGTVAFYAPLAIGDQHRANRDQRDTQPIRQVSFSPRNIAPNIATSTTDNLSIGATLAASPILSARK